MANDADAEGVIDAMAPLLGLAISKDARPGVVQHLVVAQKIARTVLAVPLDDDAEPAPVFEA
ncbi:MAG: DUF4089 domain-containing protein [Pseudomonadota bacterium]